MFNENAFKLFLKELNESCKSHSLNLNASDNSKFESLLDPEKVLFPMPFFIIRGKMKNGKTVMITAQEVILNMFNMIVKSKYWLVASRAYYTSQMFNSLRNHFKASLFGFECFLEPERCVFLLVAELIVKQNFPELELLQDTSNPLGLEFCFPFGRSLMISLKRSSKGDIDIKVDMKNANIYETCLAMHDQVNKLHVGLFSKISTHIKTTEGNLFSITISSFKASNYLLNKNIQKIH
jgi:hypothetical protein